MIYLIGGAPRIGKSIIAKSIAESTGSRFIFTDGLREDVFKKIPKDERSVKFPLPGFSGSPSENTLTPDERIEFQVIEARSLQPEIERLIAEAARNNTPIVIEGVHLLPDFVDGLTKKFRRKIRGIFIGSEHVLRITDGMAKNTNPDDWLKEADKAVRRQVATFVAAYSKWIREETERHHVTYFERTDDFVRDAKDVFTYLTSSRQGSPLSQNKR